MARTPTTGSSPPPLGSAPSAKPSKAAAKRSGSSPTSSAAATPASTQTSPDAPKRRRIDWEAVERDYRTGKFTLRELESKHGAGYAKISARAKENGWTKDLAAVVRKATSAALIAEVATARATEGQKATTDVVLAAAELNKQVILSHRDELRQARTLAMDLLAEVKSQRLLAAEKELLAQVLAGKAEDIKEISDAQRVVHKALATGSRVSSVKALAETLTKLHSGERVAFGLNEDQPPDDERASLPIEFIEPSHPDE
jgi:hypothetical protein